MTNYCFVDGEDCGRKEDGICVQCWRPRCDRHLVPAMGALPPQFQERPAAVAQAFMAAANDLSRGLACVPCREKAGWAAVAALPARPELPADPVGVLFLDRTWPSWFSSAEIDEAMMAAGGYDALLRRIYPYLQKRFPAYHVRSTVSGLLSGTTIRGVNLGLLREGGWRDEDNGWKRDRVCDPDVHLVVTADGKVMTVAHYSHTGQVSSNHADARTLIGHVPTQVLEDAVRADAD